MQSESTESTESLSFYSFLAWLHAKRKPVAVGVALVVLAGAVIAIADWKKNQNELEANDALFSVPSAVGPSAKNSTAEPQAYLKVAEAHPKTSAGQQALYLAAGAFYTEGKYAEAQAQFQKVLSEHAEAPFAAQSALGVAASLDAQGKTDEAIAKYQEVASRYPTEGVARQSKLALARLFEAQNKPEQALKNYDDLTRSPQNDIWNSEARDRREKLLVKFPNLIKTNMPSVLTNMPAPGLLIPKP